MTPISWRLWNAGVAAARADYRRTPNHEWCNVPSCWNLATRTGWCFGHSSPAWRHRHGV